MQINSSTGLACGFFTSLGVTVLGLLAFFKLAQGPAGFLLVVVLAISSCLTAYFGLTYYARKVAFPKRKRRRKSRRSSEREGSFRREERSSRKLEVTLAERDSKAERAEFS